MSIFKNMSLGKRFNLILALIFIVLLALNAADDYFRQQSLVKRDAVDTSRMLARQIIETRKYLSAVLFDEAKSNESLIPQVAATRIAKQLSKDSKYTLRQVSLRYRNPENRPDLYEAEVLEKFNKGTKSEQFKVVSVSGSRTFRYILPMVAEQSCLECHGNYESAPAYVKQKFPKGHPSYGYTVGEVIGAVSVSVPMLDLYRIIGSNLKSDLAYSSAALFIVILLMGSLVKTSIIAPIRRLSESIVKIARTGSFGESLPEDGCTEISQLLSAYNSMIEELKHRNIQKQESEERYRNVIELARSAFVTFIQDGKIVIVNRSAERLLGLRREDLIGMSLYDFIPDSEILKKELPSDLETLSEWEGSTIKIQIQDIRGEIINSELAVSATTSEGRAMYTAIIRTFTT